MNPYHFLKNIIIAIPYCTRYKGVPAGRASPSAQMQRQVLVGMWYTYRPENFLSVKIEKLRLLCNAKTSRNVFIYITILSDTVI